jgi:hypothetical protein
MVPHQAISVANPVVAADNLFKHIQELEPIKFILVDGLLPVTARSHVVKRTWIFNSERA